MEVCNTLYFYRSPVLYFAILHNFSKKLVLLFSLLFISCIHVSYIFLHFYNNTGGFSNIVFSKPGTVVVEIPLEPFGEGPYFARIADAMNLCYTNTGIHFGISFRYVDNIMVLNEDKINKIFVRYKM